MELQHAIKDVFAQLTEALGELTPEQYGQPCASLSDNTIGQHVRHVIELFLCLERAYDSGEVEYDKRKRDRLIETNPVLATGLLRDIAGRLEKDNKELLLIASYNENQGRSSSIPTNYFRELAYNLEHTVHHMALIRIGIREISQIILPSSFGVAVSTIKHRNQCVQ